MIKLIQSTQFDPEVGVGMEIVDSGSNVKQAEKKENETIFGKSYDELKPDKNHVGIHVVAMGDEEHYGPNRNADSAPADSLRKYHNTFVTNGHVFRHHRNKDPKKSIGDIVASAFNEPMGRVELFIHADKDKAAPELERLERDGEIPFSMAMMTPWDECFKKGTLVLTEYGYVPIELVDVGSVIMTADATLKSVTRKFVHESRAFTKINVRGIPQDIDCTQNHPFNVVKSSKLRSCSGTVGGKKRRHTPSLDNTGKCKTCGKSIDLSAEWISAFDIEPDDYLKVKLDDSAAAPTIGDSQAYMLGMYAGDGSLLYQHCNTTCKEESFSELVGISISASAAEKDAGVVDKITEAFMQCSGKDAVVYSEGKCKNAVSVVCNDTNLARSCHDLVGAGSTDKRIAAYLYSMSKNEKESFIAGLIDSDGCVLSFDTKKSVRISTVSKSLALGVQRLLWDVGVSATCGYGHVHSKEYEKTENSFSRRSTFSVFFSAPTSGLLERSVKLSRDWTGKHENWRGGHGIIIDNGFAYLPVKSVVSYIGDSVETYNLEVEDEHTYIVEGIAVHNCSICGQHRTGPSDPKQCVHISQQLGEVSEDGKKVFMRNIDFTFFDISFVGKPADRIAWDLMKVMPDEDDDSTDKDEKEDKDDGEEKDASYTLPFDSVKLAEYYGIEAPDKLAITSAAGLRKFAYANQLIDMHDKYVGFITKSASADSARDRFLVQLCKIASHPLKDSTIDKLRELDPGAAFRVLGDAGVVMDSTSFFKYAMGDDFNAVKPYLNGVSQKVAEVLKEAKDTSCLQKLCNDLNFDAWPLGCSLPVSRQNLFELKEELKEASCIDSLEDSVVSATIKGTRPNFVVDNSSIKILNGYVTKKLAEKYAAYKLAAIDAVITSRCGETSNQKTSKIAECMTALGALQDMQKE